MPILLEALGTVQALNTITVRAQVDGQLVEIAFREGQQVREGDVLARIDPRPYQAALDQAMAKKAQDEALLANARLDLQRYTALARNEGVSRQQQDTQRAQVAQYEAQAQADQAAIDSARTQLSFTTIRSPIDGRVGLRLVDQGNLVRVRRRHRHRHRGPVAAGRRGLHPAAAGAGAGAGRAGARSGAGAGAATGGPAPWREGALLDARQLGGPADRHDQAQGDLPERGQRLWPGAFVRVRLQVDAVPDATTVPLVAVQRGPDGPYAFVVRPDRTVEQRPLQLGVADGDAKRWCDEVCNRASGW